MPRLIICKYCGKQVPKTGNFQRFCSKSCQAKWHYYFNPKYRASIHNSYQRRYKEVRRELLEILGLKCSRCGCSDKRVLDVDHKEGKGNLERSKYKRRGGSIRYYKYLLEQIRRGSTKYQLLCANCNRIKRLERKEERKGK